MDKCLDRGGKRFRFEHQATGALLVVDTIVDGAELTLVPQDDSGHMIGSVVHQPLSPQYTLEEAVKRALAGLLYGYRLLEIESDTAEVEFSVLREMSKTPISLKDGSYCKEFVEALILCLDLRQFSNYARDEDRAKVQGFLERYTQELLAGMNACGASYYKLLGDGALAIWDRPSRETLDAAVELFTILRSVLGEVGREFGYAQNLAGALVLDEVYKYEIYAESSGLKYRDYIGYGINYSFRLQSMAMAGELLASRSAQRGFGLALPLLGEGRKPRRESIKGIRDEDYAEVYVLVGA